MIPFSVIEVDVCAKLKRYVDCPRDCLDKHVCSDLGLKGADFIRFVHEIESRWRVQIYDWLLDTTQPASRPSWLKRLIHALRKPKFRDVTMRELCERVCSEARIRDSKEEAEFDRTHEPPHYH